MAIQATEQALNVLRFYTRECRILIKGEQLEEVNRMIYTCNLEENSLTQFEESCNMEDPDYPDEVIDENLVTALEKKNLHIINDLLLKPENQLTPLQKDILTAIYWIGNAEKDLTGHDKLIKYIIALDTLMAQGRADKSVVVAKRYTGIICQGWKDNDIVERYCSLRSYYTLRNQVVHGGLIYVEMQKLKTLKQWLSELVYNILFYSASHHSIIHLLEELFPIKEDLLKAVKDEDCERFAFSK